MPLTPATYYRAPEGQDLGGKLSYALSRSALAGVACGIVDCKLANIPAGYMGTLGRVYFWTWPMVGMSTAFVTTTYIATNIRKKDDHWNYALGGAAAGAIFGTWRKSAGLGLFASCVLALSAVIKKEAVNHGYIFFPEDIRTVQQGIYSEHRDWSLVPPIPGNWVGGKE